MTSAVITAPELEKAIRALVSVRASNLGFDVQLPLVYPNGETVVVTVAAEGDEFVVHDSGNGSAILAVYGVSLTPKLNHKLSEIADHYGCEFLSGRMVRRSSLEGLPIAVAIVANSSRSIGDQMLNTPSAPIVDFKTEALEILRESVGRERVRENEAILGESGSRYTASAVILSKDQSRPVSIVEPIKDHDAATKKFREFWDISQNSDLAHLGRISLYDDRHAWAASDLNLLQNVSNIVRLTDSGSRMRELTL